MNINERINEYLDEAKKSWVDIARNVVKTSSYVYVNSKLDTSDDKKAGYFILDMTTANMLVQIADALSDVSREKFTSLELKKAVDLGWKLVSK